MRLLLGLLLSAPALAAPTLNFDGNCPGDGVFTVLGLEAGASFHFVYGEEEGSGSLSAGPCADHELSIDSPRTHSFAFTADASGAGVFDFEAWKRRMGGQRAGCRLL